MTGTPIPTGFDAVVMQVHVERGEQSITVTEPLKEGFTFRRKGDDARPGDRLLEPGREICAKHRLG